MRTLGERSPRKASHSTFWKGPNPRDGKTSVAAGAWGRGGAREQGRENWGGGVTLDDASWWNTML